MGGHPRDMEPNVASSRNPTISLLVVAAFSRHIEALDWAGDRLSETYGPIGLTSPDFPFHHTGYYEPTMGTGLRKRFLAFARLVPAETLADIKRHTIKLEADLAAERRFPEPRPLNLDPGLLQLGKFMLATTKDKDHRIYLRDGIFAEVTLRFQEGAYHPWPWTYADYREPSLLEFLKKAREFYRGTLKPKDLA
jgi:uncharacterized protein DUF4416